MSFVSWLSKISFFQTSHFLYFDFPVKKTRGHNLLIATPLSAFTTIFLMLLLFLPISQPLYRIPLLIQ